jgi:CheY-like chemotaxis protein
VDDEPAIRQLLVRGLPACGFAAWAAGGCAEAVEALRARPGEINAALIDVRMPGASGLETLAALRAVKPGLPCCLMTGYAEDRDAVLAAGADRVRRGRARTRREVSARGGLNLRSSMEWRHPPNSLPLIPGRPWGTIRPRRGATLMACVLYVHESQAGCQAPVSQHAQLARPRGTARWRQPERSPLSAASPRLAIANPEMIEGMSSRFSRPGSALSR